MQTRRTQTLTPREWQLRAQAIQADLDGLSIADIMRGGSAIDTARTGHDARNTTPISRACLRLTPMEGNGRTEAAAVEGQQLILWKVTPPLDVAENQPRIAWPNMQLTVYFAALSKGGGASLAEDKRRSISLLV